MRPLITGLLAAAVTATVLCQHAVAAEPTLVTPKVLIADPAVKPEQAASVVVDDQQAALVIIDPDLRPIA
jgi:hypothetical protein